MKLTAQQKREFDKLMGLDSVYTQQGYQQQNEKHRQYNVAEANRQRGFSSQPRNQSEERLQKAVEMTIREGRQKQLDRKSEAPTLPVPAPVQLPKLSDIQSMQQWQSSYGSLDAYNKYAKENGWETATGDQIGEKLRQLQGVGSEPTVPQPEDLTHKPVGYEAEAISQGSDPVGYLQKQAQGFNERHRALQEAAKVAASELNKEYSKVSADVSAGAAQYENEERYFLSLMESDPIAQTYVSYEDYIKAVQDGRVPQKYLPDGIQQHIDALYMATEAKKKQDDAQQAESGRRKMLQTAYDQIQQELALSEDLREIYSLSPDDMDAFIKVYDAQATNSGGAGPEWQRMMELFGYDKWRKLTSSYSQYMGLLKEQHRQEQKEKDMRDPVNVVLSNLYAPGLNLVSSIYTPIASIGQMATNNPVYAEDERYGIKTNTGIYDMQRDIRDTRSGTRKLIEGEDPNAGRKFAGMLYGGISSAVDDAARIGAGAVTGINPLGIMAVGSFSSSYEDAANRGASGLQAILYATVSAALEVATEKIPLGRLLSGTDADTVGKIIADILVKQPGLEIVGEEASYFGGMIADALIMGDKSENNQKLAAYMMAGYTKEQAQQLLAKDILYGAAQTAAETYISSAAMTGASYIGGAKQNGQTETKAQDDGLNQILQQAADTPASQTVEAVKQASKQAQQQEAVTQNTQQQVHGSNPVIQPQQNQTTQEQQAVEAAKPVNRPMDEEANQQNPPVRPVQQEPAAQPVEAVRPQPEVVPIQKQQEQKSPLDIAMEATVRGEDVQPVNPVQQESAGETQPDFGKKQPAGSVEDTKSPGDGQTGSVGAMNTSFERRQAKSRLYENTFKNSTIEVVREAGKVLQETDPSIADYDVFTEKESMYNAAARISQPGGIDMEYEDLVTKDWWSGEDNDVAMILLSHFAKTMQSEKMLRLAEAQRAQNTNAGQLIQSNAKYTRTLAGTVSKALQQLAGMERSDVSKHYWKKKGNSDENSFQLWKQEVTGKTADFFNMAESATDAAGLRDVVRKLAVERNTTAWMGTTDRLPKMAESVLNELDYDTLKWVVQKQISGYVNDFYKTSVGKGVSTIQTVSMLYSIPSAARNIIGNATMVIDAFSDSTTGRFFDFLVSKATGKRTVGNDIKYPKGFLDGAVKSSKIAYLYTALAIDDNVEAKYGPEAGTARTFKMNGNLLSRYMSTMEKHLSYLLNVPDAFSKGGHSETVKLSLNDLARKGQLVTDDVQEVADFAAKRRTFQQDGAISKLSVGAKRLLNANKSFGLGDLILKFPKIPANLAQTAIDYNGSSLPLRLKEVFSIVVDAKNGKTIDPVRQRKAVTDVARAITGTGLTIPIFTALALKGVLMRFGDDEDENKNALDRAEGKKGLQLNVSATMRLLSGEENGEAYRDGDTLISFGFLEPFNAQMNIACALAEEDSVLDMVKSYPGAAFEGTVQSILEMPLMEGAFNLFNNFSYSQADTMGGKSLDAVKTTLAQSVTGFIPAPVRQLANTVDDTYRDTAWDNPLGRAKNQVIAGIPFLSKTLPAKYDGLGNEQKRSGDIWSRALENFVNPASSSKINQSEVSAYLEDLYEKTGESYIYPESRAPKRFKVNGEDFVVSGSDRSTYQKKYGETFRDISEQLISSDSFTSMPYEEQAKVLQSVGEFSTAAAKSYVSDYEPDGWEKYAIENNWPVQRIAEKMVYNSLVKQSGLSEARYESAKEMGYSLDQMSTISSQVSDYLSGMDDKTDYDTYRAVLSATQGEERYKWLEVYGLSDSRLEAMQEARKRGYSDEQCIDAFEAASLFSSAQIATSKAWSDGKELPTDKWEEAYNAYQNAPVAMRNLISSQLSTKFTAYLELRNAGMDTKTFLLEVKKYSDIGAEDGDLNDATRWHKALDDDVASGLITTTQRNILLQNMRYFVQIPQNADKYEELKDSGLDPDSAEYIMTLAAGLLPEYGKKTVSDLQIWEQIISSDLTGSEKTAALEGYMDEKQEQKLAYAVSLGFTPSEYVDMYRVYKDTAEYGKGRKEFRIREFMNELDIDRDLAEALLEIYDGIYGK